MAPTWAIVPFLRGGRNRDLPNNAKSADEYARVRVVFADNGRFYF